LLFKILIFFRKPIHVQRRYFLGFLGLPKIIYNENSKEKMEWRWLENIPFCWAIVCVGRPPPPQ
jgi:hypothetical protein